jgi:type I restriction enzyme R subunit
MNELHLQDKFLIPFFRDGLGYKEVKANTVTQSLIIEEDLQAFISGTRQNKKPYEILLKKYQGDKKPLLQALIELIQERIASSRNMAIFAHPLEKVKISNN